MRKVKNLWTSLDRDIKRARETGRIREKRSGQYGFEGDWDRMCVCGHTLRVHMAEPPHVCASEDAHNIDSVRFPVELGPCPSDCMKFRPVKKRRVAA